MKKRTFLLAILLTAALFAGAQQYCPESDFEVRLIDGGAAAEITRYAGESADIHIPPRIAGAAVTRIGPRAFRGRGLTSVTIPDTVTVIAQEAFADNLLERVTIPPGLTVIDIETFANNRLENVTIPWGVTRIRERAFADNRIRVIAIPDTVEHIDVGAFTGNELRWVSLPQATFFWSTSFDFSAMITRRDALPPPPPEEEDPVQTLIDLSLRFLWPDVASPRAMIYTNLGIGVHRRVVPGLFVPGVYVEAGIGVDWWRLFSGEERDPEDILEQFGLNLGFRVYNRIELGWASFNPFAGVSLLLGQLDDRAPSVTRNFVFGGALAFLFVGVEYAYHIPMNRSTNVRFHHVSIMLHITERAAARAASMLDGL